MVKSIAWCNTTHENASICLDIKGRKEEEGKNKKNKRASIFPFLVY